MCVCVCVCAYVGERLGGSARSEDRALKTREAWRGVLCSERGLMKQVAFSLSLGRHVGQDSHLFSCQGPDFCLACGAPLVLAKTCSL